MRNEKYKELEGLGSPLAEDLLESISERYKALILWNTKNGKKKNAELMLSRLKSISANENILELEKMVLVIQVKDESAVDESNDRQNDEELKFVEPKTSSKDLEESNTSNLTVLIEWVEGVCLAVSSAYGDSGKVKILSSSVRQVNQLTGSNIHRLYHCSDFYGDSGKLAAIRSLANKLSGAQLTKAEFSSIIKDLYSDSSKITGTNFLVPHLKTDPVKTKSVDTTKSNQKNVLWKKFIGNWKGHGLEEITTYTNGEFTEKKEEKYQINLTIYPDKIVDFSYVLLGVNRVRVNDCPFTFDNSLLIIKCLEGEDIRLILEVTEEQNIVKLVFNSLVTILHKS